MKDLSPLIHYADASKACPKCGLNVRGPHDCIVVLREIIAWQETKIAIAEGKKTRRKKVA